MTFIDKHRSLTELYTNLLVKKREYERQEAKGEAKCLHCSQQKSVHISDGRCSLYATSRQFRNECQPDIDRVGRALDLIEELMGL